MIAVYAIVNSLLVSFKIEFVRFRNRQSVVIKALLSNTSDEDYSSDEEEDEDDASSVSSSSSVDENEHSEDEEVEKVRESNDGVFSSLFDFRVAGSSEFDEDEDVTCRFTWSNFANGKSVVKLWDGFGIGLGLDPSVVLSAGKDESNHPFLSLIDTGVGKQPVITSWSSSGCEKVRVVDLRKATEEVVEDAAVWWDAEGGGGDGDDDAAEL